METYEIAILANVSPNELAEFLCQFMHIPRDQIMPFEHYIEVMEHPSMVLIGICVYSQDEGFQSWVDLHCSNYSFDEMSFLELAVAMAEKFQTEVAIADPIWEGASGASAQLIISAEGTLKTAYYEQGDDLNTLVPYSPGKEITLTEVMQELQERKHEI